MDLITQVRRMISRHHLAAPETRVVAALSGGSDSVALVHLLDAFNRAGELTLVGLAHFNHQLRDAADADERFCAALATTLHQAYLSERDDVRALAGREHRSLEDAARTARHAFFERARECFGADVIALGHTMDDQAETLLLRLLRGAGSRGLGAMHPKRGALIRPLLDCRRQDLRAYLEAGGWSYVHDESNDDVSIPRNRVRAELLPLLEHRFNPSVVEVLASQATLAREEHEWLETEVDRCWTAVAERRGRELILHCVPLLALPLALARRLVHRAITEVSRQTAAFDDVARVLDLARTGGPAFDAHGHRAERIGSDVVLTGRPPGVAGHPARRPGTPTFFHYPLSIPGEVVLPESGYTLSAEVADSIQPGAVSGRDGAVAVRLDKCTRPLAIRNRRPGDRFRPLGMAGRKKLQDFLVDRKVVRARRDLVPLVVDAADRIVWVAGHAIDEDFRVTDPAQAVIILRLKGLGGSA